MYTRIIPIVFFTNVYAFLSFLASYIVNKIDHHVFGIDDSKKSDFTVIFEMIIMFSALVIILFYVKQIANSLHTPFFRIEPEDKLNILGMCEVIAATFFMYISKLDNKVDRFFKIEKINKIM